MALGLDLSAGDLRPMLRLAIPVLLEQFLFMLVGLSDTVITGHYFGEPELAAINLMNYTMWLLMSLFVVVSIGVTALVARSSGAGDTRTALLATNQAFLLGSLLAVGFTLIGLFYADTLIAVMQLQGQSAARAERYLWLLLPAVPAMMVESVGLASLRGAGDTVTGFFTMTLVNAINVALSWGLLLGWGPLPELGWDGLPLGTTIGHIVGGLLVLVLLGRGRSGLRLRPRDLLPDSTMLRRILRVGLPGGLDVLFIIGCQFWFVAIINALGDLPAAAHGVAIRIEALAFLPGVAFQVAAGTLAGQHLGAKRYERATRSVLLSLAVGGGVMTVAAVAFFVFPAPLAGLFVGDDSSVVNLAVPLLRIVAFGIPFLAVQMILTGALRAAGDTRYPLLFTVIGYIGVRIPLAYLLTVGWGLGVQGAWYAMVADVVLRSVLVLGRFLHGGWQRVEV